MQSHVQRVDFILTLNQVLKMISDRNTTAIRISMGITENATIEIFGEGVRYEEVSGTVTATSEYEILCPVPPDCPENVDCRQKFAILLPNSISSGELFNIQ